MKTALGMLVLWALSAWLLYLPLRSVRRGAINYRGYNWERGRHPVMFWYLTVASGLGGTFLFVASLYLFDRRERLVRNLRILPLGVLH